MLEKQQEVGALSPHEIIPASDVRREFVNQGT